jgi:putative two-component system response regulator
MSLNFAKGNKKRDGMKILIVEDDPISLEILSNFLRELGFEFESATNGREALEKMRWFTPSMVISDVEMPEMDGVTLCREIRKKRTIQYTYVILLTCRSEQESVLLGLDAGADDYLSKPFSPEELRLRIDGGRRLLSLEGRDMMIFSLAKLAESRDEDTGEHLERMREYSRLIAAELMTWPKFADVIDGQFVELIYLTSPLHDIGKVGIPDNILCKPGKLTNEEFEVMKQHTLIGANTLWESAQAYSDATFLWMAYEIAVNHHERWDGTGYPHRLMGEEIPLSARIVSVADVYDALTSKRIYKPAFSHDKSIDIIRSGRGTQFDPDVVDAFLNREDEVREIAASYCNAIPAAPLSPLAFSALTLPPSAPQSADA